jgi:hypothetical protein
LASVALFGMGFLTGAHRAPQVSELSGTAHVGDHVATVEVDGWFYGIQDSVAWLDARGALHDSGWPDCLGSQRDVVIRFGEVTVDYPGPASQRRVVYVDCRP